MCGVPDGVSHASQQSGKGVHTSRLRETITLQWRSSVRVCFHMQIQARIVTGLGRLLHAVVCASTKHHTELRTNMSLVSELMTGS